MPFLAGIVQVLVFLLLLKISHIVYWNVRKSFFIHPLLLESVLAVVFVLLFHFVSAVWALVIVTAIGLGMIRGDQDAGSDVGSAKSRHLL